MKKLLFLVSILLFPFMVNASLMHQDIEILENGDLHVKEAIAIDGSYNGFKLELIILDFQYISCFSFTLNSEHSLPVSDCSIENVFIKLYC